MSVISLNSKREITIQYQKASSYDHYKNLLPWNVFWQQVFVCYENLNLGLGKNCCTNDCCHNKKLGYS